MARLTGKIAIVTGRRLGHRRRLGQAVRRRGRAGAGGRPAGIGDRAGACRQQRHRRLRLRHHRRRCAEEDRGGGARQVRRHRHPVQQCRRQRPRLRRGDDRRAVGPRQRRQCAGHVPPLPRGHPGAEGAGQGEGPGAHRQHRLGDGLRHRLRARRLLRLQGRRRRADAHAGARARQVQHHRQLCLPRRHLHRHDAHQLRQSRDPRGVGEEGGLAPARASRSILPAARFCWRPTRPTSSPATSWWSMAASPCVPEYPPWPTSIPSPPSYSEARDKFLAAARVAGATTYRYDNPTKGPKGEALSTDVARLGPDDASQVVVTISSTHGVEGYCGSGFQVDWLASVGAAGLPKDTAAVFVHAINPYGFAWTRRVTEEGNDLNRNYVDHSKPYPVNEGYLEIADFLVPADLGQATHRRRRRQARRLSQEGGRRRLFPRGVRRPVQPSRRHVLRRRRAGLVEPHPACHHRPLPEGPPATSPSSTSIPASAPMATASRSPTTTSTRRRRAGCAPSGASW